MAERGKRPGDYRYVHYPTKRPEGSFPNSLIRRKLSMSEATVSVSAASPVNIEMASNLSQLDVFGKAHHGAARVSTRRAAIVASVGFTALLALAQTDPVAAQVAPNLGTAAPYAVLGTNIAATSGTVTCTGSAINGNVGTTFTSITNNACAISGTIDAPVNAAVVADFNSAYAAIDAANPCTNVLTPVTQTLAPGVYCTPAGFTLGAGVILTLNGSASDVWVFRIGTGGLGALTLTSAQVVMNGGANACNVYWKTAEAATLTDSNFLGTILSGAAVSMTNGTWFGRGLARTDVTITNAAPLSFAGCGAPNSISVSKNFTDNNAASVPVALTCTSGTVAATPLNASESSLAVFTVTGANPVGTTCTATETVPVGYVANQTNCVGVALGGICTITNTLGAANTITVNKDFTDNNTATVPVALTCTSGTVTATPLNASEASPAVFTVSGASVGATCRATETVPVGYSATQTNCLNVSLGGSCTIINALSQQGAALIPARSGWGMILLAGMLVLLGFATIRRLVP